MRDALVGLDIGTCGVKGLALAEDGSVLARAERELPAHRPRGPAGPSRTRRTGGRPPRRCWCDLRDAREPAGIGLSGQMHGLVALDSEDGVLRPAILWNDQRTAAECAEIEERVGLERWSR